MDTLTPERRGALMSRIRSKNTTPELVVRRLAHSLGYRFRVHRRDLPGSPDLVFPARRKVVFVHGCFWHRHDGCAKRGVPKSNVEFWKAKFDTNVGRDRRKLRALGWGVMVVWECQVRDRSRVAARLVRFLGDLS